MEAFQVILLVMIIGLPLLSFCVACICAEDPEDEEDEEDEEEEELRSPVVLPNFPYARTRVPTPEPVMCAICLDELQQGQLCSGVPACRHMFHEECIRVWLRKVNSCPLCRVTIVPGMARGGVAAADDMV